MDSLQTLRTCRKYISLHKSATTRGLDFNLSFEDVAELQHSTNCHYSKIELINPLPSNPPAEYNTKTVDRIDNSKGYVKGNVVACSYGVNALKAVFLEGAGINSDSGICTLVQKLPISEKIQLFKGLVKALELEEENAKSVS